jgi:THO complex subunit 4
LCLFQDLFQKIGSLQSLHLKYDTLGRSDGVAYVVYTHIEDAKEAIRKYNGAKAAGQQITVTLIGERPPNAAASVRQPRLQGGGGGRFTRGGGRHGPQGRGGGGRRGGGGDRRPARTQEDLDRELDDYLNSSETGGAAVVDGNSGAVTSGDAMVLD